MESKRSKRPVDLALPFRILAGLLFLNIVAMTIAQVFFRFVLNSPLIWSEELARMSVVWVTFIGGAVVCWDGTNLNIDYFFNKFTGRFRSFVRSLNLVLAIAFLVILVYFGIELVQISHRNVVGALRIPVSFFRGAVIVGAVLMIVFILLRRFYRLPRERAAGAAFDPSSEPM